MPKSRSAAKSADNGSRDRVSLLMALSGHRPVGVNKHFQMLLIHHKFCRLSGQETPTFVLWERLGEMFDLEALDQSDEFTFDGFSECRDFELPSGEFGELMASKKVTSITEKSESRHLNNGASKVQVKRRSVVKRARRTSTRLALKKVISVRERPRSSLLRNKVPEKISAAPKRHVMNTSRAKAGRRGGTRHGGRGKGYRHAAKDNEYSRVPSQMKRHRRHNTIKQIKPKETYRKAHSRRKGGRSALRTSAVGKSTKNASLKRSHKALTDRRGGGVQSKPISGMRHLRLPRSRANPFDRINRRDKRASLQ